MIFSTIISGDVLDLEFSASMDDIRVTKNKNKQKIDCVPLSANSFSLILNGRTYYLTITSQLDGYEVTVDHHTNLVYVQDEVDILLKQFGLQSDEAIHTGDIHAQIPGLVSQIFVPKGDKVKVNEKLFIL